MRRADFEKYAKRRLPTGYVPHGDYTREKYEHEDISIEECEAMMEVFSKKIGD